MSGLIHARTLRQSAERDVEARSAAVADFVRIWEAEIEHHFDDEERLLLPLTSDAHLRARLLDEHRALRELAGRCRSEPAEIAADPAALRRLGTLLHDHIRWEERVFFEAVQREHPDALASLLGAAGEIERDRPGARARYRLDQAATDHPKEPPA